MKVFRSILDRNEDGVRPKAAIFVLIVAIQNYELSSVPNLDSVEKSFERLAKFWLDVAEGRSNFVPGREVRGIGGFIARPGPDSSKKKILEAINAFFKQAGRHDFAIIHWAGHALHIPAERDYAIYLPNTDQGQDDDCLESLRLHLFTDWAGHAVACENQLFLFDCCSTKLEPGQSVAARWPRLTEDPPYEKQQIILWGSGYARKAKAADKSSPSLFTEGIIQTLEKYAGDDSRNHYASGLFLKAIAAVIQEGWIRGRLSELPRLQDLTRWDWYTKFVREMSSHHDMLRADHDRVRLGQVLVPSVHATIGLPSTSGCRDPHLEGQLAHLRRDVFAYSKHLVLWTWTGDLPPHSELEVAIRDESGMEYKEVRKAMPPLVRAWYGTGVMA